MRTRHDFKALNALNILCFVDAPTLDIACRLLLNSKILPQLLHTPPTLSFAK